MNDNNPSIISCADVLSKLYAFLDGEIDDLTEADIEHHLHHCRECFSRVEFEKKLKERVRETGTIETPPEVKSRLQDIMSKF
ncbi:MAG: zf-HC2 domain-containing protein [Granulosicoccus sp.]|nr:zf-HC2 domain-containing protein [Granulosicoccus sp.]